MVEQSASTPPFSKMVDKTQTKRSNSNLSSEALAKAEAVAHEMGFTLIELSIVLVIIGLIVGGVLVGQDLIKAAGIRSQMSEWEKFNTSILVFKNKYNCLPGDCSNATRFFTAVYPQGISNGNGNGFINDSADQNLRTAGELEQLWAQLYSAGLTRIDGMTLAACCAAAKYIPGVTVPTLSFIGGYSAWYANAACVDSSNCTNASYTRIPTANYIMTGMIGNANYFDRLWSAHPTVSNGANNYQLLPSEAFAIDSKIDDGKPRLGSVMTTKTVAAAPYDTYAYLDQTSNQCITSVADNNYNSSNNTRICSLVLKAPW